MGPGCRVLDIGCGSGRHACEAARTSGALIIAADIDYDEVVTARNSLNFLANCGECRSFWSTMVADITRLPFADASFDVVICAEILEHIRADQTAIRELVRILAPDGHLVISVPRNYPERICWLLSTEYHTAANGHVRIYSKTALIRALTRHGLRCSASHHAHSLHSPFWWLKCMVGPGRDNSRLVGWYHRFLVWDIMHHPRVTRLLDRLLNPVLGKSLVLYFRKNQAQRLQRL